MKITLKQLRKLVKEEVQKMVEAESLESLEDVSDEELGAALKAAMKDVGGKAERVSVDALLQKVLSTKPGMKKSDPSLT
jgi:KaiC/GvpD/RAD55 family RecA-like ATPase